eukprot:631756-Pelagomonas_calceolata.AAC.12
MELQSILKVREVHQIGIRGGGFGHPWSHLFPSQPIIIVEEFAAEDSAKESAYPEDVSTAYVGYKHTILGLENGPRLELWRFWDDLRPRE